MICIPHTVHRLPYTWCMNSEQTKLYTVQKEYSFFRYLCQSICISFETTAILKHWIDRKNEDIFYSVCNALFRGFFFIWKTTKRISIFRFELTSTFLFWYFHLTIFHHFMYLTILVRLTIVASIPTKNESQKNVVAKIQFTKVLWHFCKTANR